MTNHCYRKNKAAQDGHCIVCGSRVPIEYWACEGCERAYRLDRPIAEWPLDLLPAFDAEARARKGLAGGPFFNGHLPDELSTWADAARLAEEPQTTAA